MADKFVVDNAKERLLCYSAGILGAWLGNNTITATAEVDDWMIKRAINAAKLLIETIYVEK
jgi:hypothetical protein